MEHIAPLIQTVLWVGLIAGIVWRFHSPIYGLLVALQKRIEDGSSVKAGPFEISDQIKPQDPIAQKEKAAGEVQEVLQGQDLQVELGQALSPVATESGRAAVMQSRYFQAEDLVLRSLQAEYGVPVNRQVTAGRDGGFDGLFLANGRTNVVEVKYFAGRGRSPAVRMSVQRLTAAIREYGWENTQIILALVFENAEDVKSVREMLSSAFSGNDVPVVLRVFTMDQLREQFGVANDTAS
ncbi:MAG: hypothetical protein Q8M93_01580 [Polaromonas sp.]|uniref:hypothetical protein n=1 Tax=Polaromonas sp. TaxID=1869339 RepID=UPI002730F970|nr:hypothetical protein [Polaromonas sp.]MDP2450135.1 hypothetical protein [Polaromonas sp.]MDP3245638.1 hypothetical protein [Polaromonas sp.]MDP3757637.1 hypothetical protein [Polaromonas sp.]